MKTVAVDHGADALLSVEDVLQEIPVSRSALAVLRRADDFPAALKLTPGARRVFFRAGDVREWIASRGVRVTCTTTLET
jgi:predicted DNA-binding transcriptional regulator AlpA